MGHRDSGERYGSQAPCSFSVKIIIYTVVEWQKTYIVTRVVTISSPTCFVLLLVSHYQNMLTIGTWAANISFSHELLASILTCKLGEKKVSRKNITLDLHQRHVKMLASTLLTYCSCEHPYASVGYKCSHGLYIFSPLAQWQLLTWEFDVLWQSSMLRMHDQACN
jgi:hypothetical protein